MQSRYRCFWKRGAVLALCLAAAALSPQGADSAEAAATLGDVHKVYAAATKDRTVMLEREAVQKEVENPVKTDGGRDAGATAAAPGSVKPPEPLNPGAKGAERILPKKLRFLWQPVADAVRYEFVIEEGAGEKAKVVYRDTHVFNNGVEIALAGRGWLDANHYWRVRALDYDACALHAACRRRAGREGSGRAASDERVPEDGLCAALSDVLVDSCAGGC